jgi:quercetin dioxygenase-like cupin family protein
MKIHLPLLLSLAFAVNTAAAESSAYKRVEPLLASEQTVIGETLAYPPGKAKITSSIVTIQPGEETAWHKHGAPLYAYILSGEVTVDYGDKGTKRFSAGGAFMEAMDHWHRGTNLGKEPVRILAVYLGSDQVDNVIRKPEE